MEALLIRTDEKGSGGCTAGIPVPALVLLSSPNVDQKCMSLWPVGRSATSVFPFNRDATGDYYLVAYPNPSVRPVWHIESLKLDSESYGTTLLGLLKDIYQDHSDYLTSIRADLRKRPGGRDMGLFSPD